MNKIAYPEALAAMRAVHERLDRAWIDVVAEFDPDPPGTINVFDEFALVTVQLLRESDPNLQPLFELVELLIEQGDQQVVECVAVGFVETLSNTWPQDLDPTLVTGRLGPRALEHAQGWAHFWGAPF